MRKSTWLFVVKAGTFLMTGTFLMAGMFLMTGLSVASAAQFDKVIEERKQLMKGIGGASKAMRSAADAAGVAASAGKLAAAFAKINADTFPKGSSDGSRAKPEIWEQWDKFAAAAKNAVTLSQAIATKARAGENTAELVKAFGKNACGTCHGPFRKPKPKS
jgi:cytochrome c556